MNKKKFILHYNTTVTAHSGCENTADNSVESIIRAAECGADVVEIDINFDNEGNPVLSHDTPCGGELTLEKAFEILSGIENIRINLDIKNTDCLYKIPDIARKYSLYDRIFYTGIFEDFVPAVREQTKDIPYYLNTKIVSPDCQDEKYFEALAEKTRMLGAIGINPNFSNVTKELTEYFHSQNLLVSLWTANEDADIEKVLALAPDNITTRFPSKFTKKETIK